MHFLCLKTPQITCFLHRVSPGLPESATKVAVSVLWVSYACKNTVHCFSMLLHKCTPVLLGQISTFLQFSGTKSAIYHNQRSEYCLSCLVSAFSSLVAAFYNTFRKVFLVPLSTSARNQEKHQKNAKTRFFRSSAIFFAEKHFIGCRYICDKTSLTCTNDSPSKKAHFQNFRLP